MRLLFVSHNFVRGNGQGRINLEIVAHARRAGHDVTLVANQVADELLEAGVRWRRVRQIPNRPNLVGVRTFVAAADRVVDRLRRRHDVVIGGGYTLTRPHDVNLCQFVHGAWRQSPVHVSRVVGGLKGRYQALYSRANAGWEKRAYAAAAVTVAPSEKIRQELIGIGVPADRLRVIYNGVDTDEFRPATAAEKQAERAAFGLPADAVLALFVGDIRTPRKNLDTVLKALPQLPGVHLVIVGDAHGSPFPAMARSLGVADRTHFVGYSLDVRRYMRACDLFVFPSRYEAGTLVLGEAAATGLPLVTAVTAGGAEAFPADAAAVLNDPDDLPGLVAAIKQFGDDPTRRASAGAAARQTACGLTWRHMAGRYLELLEQRAAVRESEGVPA